MSTIIVYTCNWDAYSGLEKAGFEHLAYPASVYPLKVSCLGRLHPGLVLRAFELGADGVLLLGCPPDQCHYDFGNKRAQELFAETAALAHLLGIGEERLRLDWVAAGDGQGFVQKVSRFAEGGNRGIRESGNQENRRRKAWNLELGTWNMELGTSHLLLPGLRQVYRRMPCFSPGIGVFAQGPGGGNHQ